jgi:hypothetical protein
MAHLDPELEHFKRSIDLVAFAKKAGYVPSSEAVGSGVTVLDLPGRDRIAVAQTPSGIWIYASVGDYQPRGPHESEAHALARLRGCVLGARDKGTVVEFVLGRDAAARSAEVPLDRVREHLRAFRDAGVVLDLEGRPRLPPDDRDGPELSRTGATAERKALPGGAAARGPQDVLNQRRYDWSPPVPNAPRETEVEQRLRRWREAQEAIDQRRVPQSRGGQARPLGPSPTPGGGRGPGLGQSPSSALNRRRYDWTPSPGGRDAIAPVPRGGRSSGRDR